MVVGSGGFQPKESGKPSQYETATFAGGCFWCMEPPFDHLKGVLSVMPGYMGGTLENPSYEEVSSGKSGHAECVQVIFDPKIVGYQELLEIFWHNIDPTVKNKQFCDIGSQYRTAIFYHNEDQHAIAEQSKKELIEFGKVPAIATEITRAGKFYPAEEYHQKFYQKNPQRYTSYKTGSGRSERLRQIWGG